MVNECGDAEIKERTQTKVCKRPGTEPSLEDEQRVLMKKQKEERRIMSACPSRTYMRAPVAVLPTAPEFCMPRLV